MTSSNHPKHFDLGRRELVAIGPAETLSLVLAIVGEGRSRS
jgi:hypothetical protein